MKSITRSRIGFPLPFSRPTIAHVAAALARMTRHLAPERPGDRLGRRLARDAGISAGEDAFKDAARAPLIR